MTYNLDKSLEMMTRKELVDFCKENKIKGYSKLKKIELIEYAKEYLGKTHIENLKKDESIFCYPDIIDEIYSFLKFEDNTKQKRIEKIIKTREECLKYNTIWCNFPTENVNDFDNIVKQYGFGSYKKYMNLFRNSRKFSHFSYSFFISEFFCQHTGQTFQKHCDKKRLKSYLRYLRYNSKEIDGKTNKELAEMLRDIYNDANEMRPDLVLFENVDRTLDTDTFGQMFGLN